MRKFAENRLQYTVDGRSVVLLIQLLDNAATTKRVMAAGALARLPALLRKHQPSVLVVELGGNDALRGLAPAQLRGNLEKILLAADQAGARVLLLGIDVPPNYGPAYRERIRRSYAELATAHQAGLVPFFLEGVALQPGLMQADGLHPTAAAQPRLLDNVWPALAPLL